MEMYKVPLTCGSRTELSVRPDLWLFAYLAVTPKWGRRLWGRATKPVLGRIDVTRSVESPIILQHGCVTMRPTHLSLPRRIVRPPPLDGATNI